MNQLLFTLLLLPALLVAGCSDSANTGSTADDAESVAMEAQEDTGAQVDDAAETADDVEEQAVVDEAAESESAAEEEGLSYKPFVRVSTSIAGRGIRIEVEDNGTGMDRETARHAFEPLFTTRARGTGLGLAIVRKIIDEHGGSVSLKSETDVGTTVEFVIPGGSQPSQEQEDT